MPVPAWHTTLRHEPRDCEAVLCSLYRPETAVRLRYRAVQAVRMAASALSCEVGGGVAIIVLSLFSQRSSQREKGREETVERLPSSHAIPLALGRFKRHLRDENRSACSLSAEQGHRGQQRHDASPAVFRFPKPPRALPGVSVQSASSYPDPLDWPQPKQVRSCP